MTSPGQPFEAVLTPQRRGAPVAYKDGLLVEVVHVNAATPFEVLATSADGAVTVVHNGAPTHEVLLRWDVPPTMKPGDIVMFRARGLYIGSTRWATTTVVQTLTLDLERVLVEVQNAGLWIPCCEVGG